MNLKGDDSTHNKYCLKTFTMMLSRLGVSGDVRRSSSTFPEKEKPGPDVGGMHRSLVFDTDRSFVVSLMRFLGHNVVRLDIVMCNELMRYFTRKRQPDIVYTIYKSMTSTERRLNLLSMADILTDRWHLPHQDNRMKRGNPRFSPRQTTPVANEKSLNIALSSCVATRDTGQHVVYFALFSMSCTMFTLLTFFFLLLLLDSAKVLLQRALDHDVHPNLLSVSSLVKLWAQAGDFEEMERWIQQGL